MNAKGNGPPKNLDPSDLWSQITTLPRAHRVVPFPRNDRDGLPIGKVAICVLEGDEVTLSNINAEKHARDQYKKIVGELPKNDEVNEAYSKAFNARATREIIFRSCKKAHECEPDDRGVCLVDHDKLSSFFPTLESIGKLSTDEQAVLANHYFYTQAEVGPIVANMSQAEMDAWIEVLGKGGSTAPLALLSLDQASGLLMYMASRLYNLLTATDSPTTQPESTTSNG